MEREKAYRSFGPAQLEESLIRLYGEKKLGESKKRCEAVMAGFAKTFGGPCQALYSAPGRTELGGNHTDHQHGRVLAAAVNLDMMAAVALTRSGKIRVMSEGYPMLTVSLDELTMRPQEKYTTAALVRGVAARFAALQVELGGFDAYITSQVAGGSGLSSSACFEVLIGVICNDLFAQNRLPPVEIAKIAQYAENEFFGKPCGLMDQTACAVGGVVAINFADPLAPMVEKISFDLASSGYSLCIIDSGADHMDLTAEYTAITQDMAKISHFFGKKFLRDVPEADFMENLASLRLAADDRAILRSMHFFAENKRAADQATALRGKNFSSFLDLVGKSGRSSLALLQNIVPTGQVERQDLMLAIALAEHLLGGRGAVRVHGGGFGGTAQAYVPLSLTEVFQQRMEALLGEGCCRILSIRQAGGVRIL